MRSSTQSKAGTMPLRKTAARKIKPHPVDRMANRQSSGAILANLVSGR
jgi:hypothetical protein